MRQILSVLLLAQLALLWPVASPAPPEHVLEAAVLPEHVLEAAVLPDREFEPDLLLDSAARWYLPVDSEARRETKGWFWCGTPYSQFLQREGDRLVDEAELVRRAHWLVGLVKPADVGEYAQVPRQCRTPGCAGKVSLAYASKLRIEDDAGFLDYRELDEVFSLNDMGFEIRRVVSDTSPQRKKRRQRGR